MPTVPQSSNAEFLSQYFGGRSSRAPSNTDVAKFILLNASTSKPLGPGTDAGKGNEPSFMSRIFDILSRPNYAVASLIDTGDPEEFFRGLAGKNKTTFSDVLETAGMGDTPLRAGLGFALDVGLDPTTYIPGAAIAKGLSKVRDVARGSKGIEAGLKTAGNVTDRTLAQRMLGRGEPVNPEAYGLESESKASIPEILRSKEIPSRVSGPRDIDAPGKITGISKALDIMPGQLELPLEGIPRNPPGSVKLPVDEPIVPSSAFREVTVRRPKTVSPKKSKDDIAFEAMIRSVANPDNWRGYSKTQKAELQAELRAGLNPEQQRIIDNVLNPKSPAPDASELTLRISDDPVKGQQAFRFPDFNLANIRRESAPSIIEKLAKGDPEAALRAIPKPPKAVPDKRDIADASQIVKGWDPSKTTAELNKRFPESLNAKQQVKLYYKARDAARARFKNPNAAANAGRIDNIAVKIYLATEKALEEAGFVPRIGTGENVKLSDVINELGGARQVQGILNEFGSEIRQGSQTWQAIQALKARGVVGDAPKVQQIVEKVQQSAVETESSKLLSDSQLSQVQQVLKNIGTATARTSGVSPAAVNATGKLIDTALNAGKSAAAIAVEQKSKILDDIVAGGKATAAERPGVNAALTRGLESDLGRIPRWAQNDNKAVEFLMGRVATWWGQRELRPLSLNAIGSASATAQARGKALDELFMPYNQAERHEALKLAQGIGAPTSEGTYQLATQIKRMMDNLVGQVSGQSVILRSGISLDALNKWMVRYKVGSQFSNKTVKTSLGQVIDYSKGTDWVNSWKSFTSTEDPKVFLFKVQEAMEQATREKALFDEIGERFGVKAVGKGFRNKIQHPYLEGYYFTDDITKQLPRVIKDWSVGPWNTNSPLLRQYDRVLSMWKAGVTIYRPGHHIRNMIGDVYLGFTDGVTGVKPYVLAARVQRLLKDSYSDLMDVDELVKLGVMGRQFGTPMPGEVIFKNKSGTKFTADQIAAVAHQKGLLEHARTLEDIIDLGEGSKFQPFGGRVQKVARSASELQSHNARLAHFIDKVMKSRGTDLEDIFEQASRRARKWHPTGLDLTEFERKVMRRIIPFYSWIRKSTPLLLEGLVMNPGKAVIPAKLYDAIQDAQGIDTPGRSDPFPVDQMFPDWIRAQGIGPISTGEGFLGKFSDQMPPGYVMGGMGINPLAELMSQAESPGKTVLSSLTPAVGVPLELLQGRKSFTGEPILGPEARPGAFGQYVGENIPGYSVVQGITGVTPFGDETRRESRSDQAGKESFYNWLTGLGVRGTGPYVKQARFEAQAPFLTERKAKKEDFLEELRRQLEETGY